MEPLIELAPLIFALVTLLVAFGFSPKTTEVATKKSAPAKPTNIPVKVPTKPAQPAAARKPVKPPASRVSIRSRLGGVTSS